MKIILLKILRTRPEHDPTYFPPRHNKQSRTNYIINNSEKTAINTSNFYKFQTINCSIQHKNLKKYLT
jgi:hypothetical protein